MKLLCRLITAILILTFYLLFKVVRLPPIVWSTKNIMLLGSTKAIKKRAGNSVGLPEASVKFLSLSQRALLNRIANASFDYNLATSCNKSFSRSAMASLYLSHLSGGWRACQNVFRQIERL